MQKNVPTFFWLLFFQFLHGSKGEFLNYIPKCNRLKSTNVQPEKKKNDTLNKVWKILCISGYKRHLEALALLSFPPKNATLELQARRDSLLSRGTGTAGQEGSGSPSAAPCACTTETSRNQDFQYAITQRQNLRNLYSPTFGKYSEPQEGLSITMYIIGNGTDFAQTQSPPLFKLEQPSQGIACVDRWLSY